MHTSVKLLNIHKQRRRKDKKTYWEIDFSIEIKENFLKKVETKTSYVGRCLVLILNMRKWNLEKFKRGYTSFWNIFGFYHTSDSNYLEEYSGN